MNGTFSLSEALNATELEQEEEALREDEEERDRLLEQHNDVPPYFNKDYRVTMKVHNLKSPGPGKETMRSKKCSYSTVTGFGHRITGISCEPSVGLPAECFCWNDKCSTPYVSLSELLQSITALGRIKSINRIVYEKDRDDRDKISWIPWKVHFSGVAPGTEMRAMPQSVSVNYDIHSFEFLTTSRDDGKRNIFLSEEENLIPKGIFCQRPDIYRRRIPDIEDQFSVKIETIDKEGASVSYTEQNFDLRHNLVSFKFAPKSHSIFPSIFFSQFAISSKLPEDSFNIVHDFESGLQYTINQRTGNCSIQKIPLTSPEAELVDSTHARLKHAKEMLDSSASDYQYSGQRVIRGILCDIFFSHHDWIFNIDEVNPTHEVPVGMATYYARSKNSSDFDNVLMSHYITFNPSQPSWNEFDVSACLRKFSGLYLKLTLDVSYSQLVQFSLRKAQDSIRSAIAHVAKISPLRLSDLHLSSTPGQKEGIDVWFVLLSGPPKNLINKNLLRSNEDHVMISGDSNEAYNNLVKIIESDDVPLRLKMDQNNEMVILLRRDSLQVAPESVHPSSRGNHRYRFYRVSYTAGSMAGLGFSMAILGICVGIFLGFLLWKRRLGVPYQLSP
ncbi:unnamed protein product [Lepeophtheirus salmonis]|uniref:(salmon louse) hypothetical protein n=1 Tax=Lepeophtheirus salmonis TaxID=72036 RepID=A0A7R8CZC2_LEPSM|nr:unnamed protein product [Lepeophtheirus salmonis]CAF2948796.1 unnamed protein product [Lepeophtheirus salmonis]